MKTERIELQYHLQCRTALHCGTGLRLGLIHRSVARDATGLVYIPGATVKGVLRDQATRLAHLLGLAVSLPHRTGTTAQDLGEFAVHPDLLTNIFGSRFRPGSLWFDDAKLCEEDRNFFYPSGENQPFVARQTETRTQVSLSRRTGTARRQLLFTTEYGIPELRFEGRIAGLLCGVPLIDGTTTYALLLLLAAVQSLDALGGSKSTGAGQVTCMITRLTVEGKAQSVEAYLALLPEFEVYELAAEEAH